MIFPCHNQSVTIRLAREQDLMHVKQLAHEHERELGYTYWPSIKEARAWDGLLVAVRWNTESASEVIVGFALFHLLRGRLKGKTHDATLYDLAVSEDYRREGIATRLIDEIVWRVALNGGSILFLKCPQNLPANDFYQQYGFKHTEISPGKRQALNHWVYRIPSFPLASKQRAPAAQFFASLTIQPGEMQAIHQFWHNQVHHFNWKRGKPNPFRRVLLSPLTAHNETMRFVLDMKISGETEEIMFDSGGYSVQKGQIKYADLADRLHSCYVEHDWADSYVLPDNPPLTSDHPADRETKIAESIQGSLRLQALLPETIRKKTIPVIHATCDDHIRNGLREFALSKRVAFGSFNTSGPDQGTNRIDAPSLTLIRRLAKTAAERNIQVHAFGIALPPAIYLLSRAGVHSFDSNGWMRSGGYGKVFLPFMQGRVVSASAPQKKQISETAFRQWKHETKHDCPFCRSFGQLRQIRHARILHNLVVMAELETHQRTTRTDLIKEHAPMYYDILPLTQEAQ